MDPVPWLCQCWPTSKNLTTIALHGHRMWFKTIGMDGEQERVRERVREVHDDDDTIYQPLRSGRIWHKVSFFLSGV